MARRVAHIAHAAQDAVVLDEHRPRVQPRRDELRLRDLARDMVRARVRDMVRVRDRDRARARARARVRVRVRARARARARARVRVKGQW